MAHNVTGATVAVLREINCDPQQSVSFRESEQAAVRHLLKIPREYLSPSTTFVRSLNDAPLCRCGTILDPICACHARQEPQQGEDTQKFDQGLMDDDDRGSLPFGRQGQGKRQNHEGIPCGIGEDQCPSLSKIKSRSPADQQAKSDAGDQEGYKDRRRHH